MTYKYIDANPNLKNDIDTYVQEVVTKKVKEIARTAAENACRDYMSDYLTEKVSVEVEKFETERVEDAVAYVLKRYGIIARVNDSAGFETVKTFLETYPKLFDNVKNMTTDEVYNLYCEMCEEEEVSPLHKKSFSRELNRLAGIKTKVKSVKGKAFRIYTR